MPYKTFSVTTKTYTAFPMPISVLKGQRNSSHGLSVVPCTQTKN